ncbi:hypothetical protein EV356DRAFT_346601 [Viridothelium virens]|uniref:Uncharacterized protein n=1 Tax=Viridothelium virens TaxID=1048519 RepID=A0A6A6GWZ7_VIRVR|nr:hypothetical protein EV356DRAFT_346601 [Viridothelium virens]
MTTSAPMNFSMTVPEASDSTVLAPSRASGNASLAGDLSGLGNATTTSFDWDTVCSVDAAQACWSEWNAYTNLAASTSCWTIEGVTEVVNTYTDALYQTYTLCDGVPRAVETASAPSYSVYTTSVYLGGTRAGMNGYKIATTSSEILISGIRTGLTVWTSTTPNLTWDSVTCTSSYPDLPIPSCAVPQSACQSLYDKYSSDPCSITMVDITTPVNPPPCTLSTTRSNTNSTIDPCSPCWIDVDQIQLLYFPVTMTGDFCGNYSTVSPTATSVVTVEALGTTFTSGTAYISYNGARAYGNYGRQCGEMYPAGIFAVPSSSLSSYRLPPVQSELIGNQKTLFPFDFADLPPNPVPAPAWSSQITCAFDHNCGVITEADYAPFISFLPFFTSLDPRWIKCSTSTLGIFDPPYALQQASFAAGPAPISVAPLTESLSETRSPDPGYAPTPAAPYQTSIPKQTSNVPPRPDKRSDAA